MSSSPEIEAITSEIHQFINERDWGQFHNPKELATAISIEAAELLEHFLWKTPQECKDHVEHKREEVSDEISDIAIYLFELADNIGIDLLAAMRSKMVKNAAKYPVEKARGSHKKYTEL